MAFQSSLNHKLLSKSDLLHKRTELKQQNLKVAFTNGCFDLLHPGHIHYLEESKSLADFLIIGLNSDRSVQENKGPGRPINTEQDRAKLLCALACVDALILFDEKTPIALLEWIKPDIHIKGGDYKIETLPERDIIQSYGGEIKILQFLPGYSTTALIEKIKTK